MSAQLMHESIPTTTTGPAGTTTELASTTTELAATTSRGRLRRAWHRIFLAFQEINYANRRSLELQVPWIVDEPRRRR
jgi:hypothetical protein